jgi:hypothetical protein
MVMAKKPRPAAKPVSAETSKPAAPAIVSPLKCWRCERALADAAGPGTSIRCMRCGARTQVPE